MPQVKAIEIKSDRDKCEVPRTKHSTQQKQVQRGEAALVKKSWETKSAKTPGPINGSMGPREEEGMVPLGSGLVGPSPEWWSWWWVLCFWESWELMQRRGQAGEGSWYHQKRNGWRN